jgi:2-haloacid dehalogenase
VPGALQRLQQAGFRLAALTNSPPETAQAQLQHAGLAGYFEQILSVHATGRFKPAPEPYHFAARQLGVSPEEMRMIAAHDWDVAGALSAGCQGAFVARPGMVMGDLLPRPDITGRNLNDIADQLIP